MAAVALIAVSAVIAVTVVVKSVYQTRNLVQKSMRSHAIDSQSHRTFLNSGGSLVTTLQSMWRCDVIKFLESIASQEIARHNLN